MDCGVVTAVWVCDVCGEIVAEVWVEFWPDRHVCLSCRGREVMAAIQAELS